MELPQPGGVNNLNNINIEPAVQQVEYLHISLTYLYVPLKQSLIAQY